MSGCSAASLSEPVDCRARDPLLSAAHRLNDAASFRETTRRGRRASSRTLVTHLAAGPDVLAGHREADPPGPARVGFVVSKAVGNSVTRSRVQRRLRHLMREDLPLLPGESTLVVRALPAAALASYDELRGDLLRCLIRSSE